ncbi:hypothetical protein PLESTB_000558300 [Pleodorina starrii]|uniref:DUF1517 domain-containing protein n=1 Tax=Pleodorina starrii TaxID=330485 RepID=A0A9W6BHH3_9CHLO|nr:hypothetical protein PLESTM_000283500 [Pleodorina starrii]GLC51878.1 hypothetical protein PLESTB_000558300 [Pleodorina starrii]GLC74559.1 hypothetical protein PLESTF_001527100 [Pleodorina starrii]
MLRVGTAAGRASGRSGMSMMRRANTTSTIGAVLLLPAARSRVAALPTARRGHDQAREADTPALAQQRVARQLRGIAFAALASASLVLGPCDHAEAARTGGRVGGHRTALAIRKRAPPSAPGLAGARHRPASSRHRVPMSLRLRALPPHLLAPDTLLAGGISPRPPLLVGDILAYPDLAAGIDLEALPLWASLLGLLAANLAGLALTIAVIRNLQDSGEPLTVVKVQVAMLERRPQLQSKLRELSSMIQVGQQGAWLILEEAILQLLQHQGTIAYASVTTEQLASKKRAYTVFGEIAEAEAAKANSEEAVVRHMGETSDEEDGRPDGGGLFGGLMGGLGLGPSKPVKELTVITLVLAARGKLDIPGKVSDWPSLRHALQQVTGLSSDRIMAVELLWTPRDETDYLTRAQLEKDYPNLVPFGSAEAAGHR